jgi:hypothetical protein
MSISGIYYQDFFEYMNKSRPILLQFGHQIDNAAAVLGTLVLQTIPHIMQ